MALTANRELNRYVDQELRSYPVTASAHIFKGVLIGIDRTNGHARNLTASDHFAGIAYEEVDNSAGAAGDALVRVYTTGDFVLPVTGATQALVGTAVYATDNESATVAPGQGATIIGILMASVSTNVGIVRILPVGEQFTELAVNAPLTSSTSAATTQTIFIPQRPIRIISAQVVFRTVPDVGLLDVGTVPADPDEMVDAFNLATLSVNTPVLLTLVSRIFAAGLPIHAKVGQATSTAGQGGMLSIRYIELP